VYRFDRYSLIITYCFTNLLTRSYFFFCVSLLSQPKTCPMGQTSKTPIQEKEAWSPFHSHWWTWRTPLGCWIYLWFSQSRLVRSLWNPKGIQSRQRPLHHPFQVRWWIVECLDQTSTPSIPSLQEGSEEYHDGRSNPSFGLDWVWLEPTQLDQDLQCW